MQRIFEEPLVSWKILKMTRIASKSSPSSDRSKNTVMQCPWHRLYRKIARSPHISLLLVWNKRLKFGKALKKRKTNLVINTFQNFLQLPNFNGIYSIKKKLVAHNPLIQTFGQIALPDHVWKNMNIELVLNCSELSQTKSLKNWKERTRKCKINK